MMSKTKAEQRPGFHIHGEQTHFCYFCPDAKEVECEIFDEYENSSGYSHEMKKDSDGYWHLLIHKNLSGKWYGYRVNHGSDLDEGNRYKNSLFADPYSRHVTVRNNYRQEAKSFINNHSFDWNGDTHCFPDDIRDLVIYETHLRDLTAHPSSKSTGQGDYNRFSDKNQIGGISYLKKLGVNCVEFLPLQKFAPVEPPFGKQTGEGFLNSWNPYSENYWGYMTSFFFAPETRFASDHGQELSGSTDAAATEFKQTVKSLHSEGITVLMDVVYNHTSLFDLNPLTHLCPHSYLRYDEKGRLRNRSGTGNEYASEKPIARKLMLDSIRYWIEEYHIDGFRFDLAALLDRKSWDFIKKEVHKIDPRVVLIAEPWGGHYAPAAFSEHSWSSWNDRFRNSIKGSDPIHSKGFIFSDWQHETGRGRLENVMKGTLSDFEGGLFQSSEHSVNYLESHDGYTLADFIRIGLNPMLTDQKIKDKRAFTKLNSEQLDLSKLAALTLFTAQGSVMIHAGQEFARSKIVADSDADDPDIGKIDHNSYQKDNETNWLDFSEIELNRSLFNYYRGLINLRQQSPALRKSSPDDITFEHYDNPLLLSFTVRGNSTGDIHDYYVALNANWSEICKINLPSGSWELIANKQIVSSQSIDILSGEIKVPNRGGLLLRKFRH